jgi:DNA-binding winged helix-turn-helix (wHTH) protein
MPLRFGAWIFDGESRELSGPKGAAHLSPKAFELLSALLESRPRALSKAELRDRLWAATFVTDASLASLVKEVRKALGDPVRRPAFVRTVHGFGYSFCGEATEVPRAAPSATRGAVCRLLWGPREFVLTDGENVLGRVSMAPAGIDSTTVSRRHARILISAEGATLEDLGSKNGTFLRGQRLTGPAELRDGDEIRLGSVLLTFQVSSPVLSTETYGGPPSEP